MKTILFVTVLLSTIGCGGESADVPREAAACYVGPSDVTSYGDCKVTTSDGLACITECGRLPGDGGLGTTLATGCQVQIGTSTPRTGICVASCADCR